MTDIPMKRKLAVLWPYLALLALALTASGFWYIGAAQIKKSLYESQDISFNDISVGGFPSQYRIVIDEYTIKLPQGNLSGEKLTAVRMFYDFNHTIIWAEGRLHFEGKSGDQLTLNGESIQASHVMGKDGEDYFSDARISVDLQKPRIQVRPAFVDGMNISSTRIQFYSLPTETNQTRLLLNAGSLMFAKTNNQNILSLQKAIVETMLPPTLEKGEPITLDNLILDINLPSGELLGIQGDGKLGRSNEGYLDGTLNLNFQNMASVLSILQTHGFLTMDQQAILTLALQLKAGSSKSGAAVEALPMTLAFKRGRVFFGPIDIGPAPKL